MNEKIEDDISARKIDHGQLNKQKKTSTSDLEHLVGKKERHAGEALKTQVKLT